MTAATYWSSPFPLPQGLEKTLHDFSPAEKLDLSPFRWPSEGRLLLFYLSPISLLSHVSLDNTTREDITSIEDIINGYSVIADLHNESSQHSVDILLLSADRINPDSLGSWLSEGIIFEKAPPLQTPSALDALLTLQAVQQFPSLLNFYLDLELKADLMGREPDLQCLKDWQELSSINEAAGELQLLRKEVNAKNDSLISCEEEAKTHLLNLHKTLEELEAMHVASHDNKSRLLKAEAAKHDLDLQIVQREQDLSSLNKYIIQLEVKVTSLEDELQMSKDTLNTNLLQIQSLQEEIESRFNDWHQYRELVGAQAEQITRAAKVTMRLARLNGLTVTGMESSVQMLALLEGYRQSLKRAERFLTGT